MKQIVIEIPDHRYKQVKDNIVTVDAYEVLWQAVQDGIPLPKGHGRLIDADDIDNHIIGSVNTRDCPTIIEADKENR